MSGKIFAFVLFLFIAGNGCLGGKAFAPVLAPVNQQRFKVLVASNAAKGSLDAANATIQSSISASKTSLDQLLISAQNSVAQGQQVAESLGQNVLSCVNSFDNSISVVDSTTVDSCDQSAQLSLLKFKVGGISIFNAHLGLIYGMCAGQYFSPVAITPGVNPGQCFEDQVAAVDKQLTDVQTQIDADISTISQAAQNCIDDVVAGYSRAIAAASSQFTKCTQA